MNRSMLTSRRAFLASAAILPVALPCTALAEPLQTNERADLLALIAELENAPRYQACFQHWINAHVAGQLRDVLGMDVPPCDNRHAFALYEAQAIEDFKRYSKNYPEGFWVSQRFFSTWLIEPRSQVLRGILFPPRPSMGLTFVAQFPHFTAVCMIRKPP